MKNSFFVSTLGMLILSFVLSDSICLAQISETISIQSSTYQPISSAPAMERTHWGKQDLEAILLDRGATAQDVWWSDVCDMAVIEDEGVFEFFYLQRGHPGVMNMQTESLDDWPGLNDEVNQILTKDGMFGDQGFASGFDAWNQTNGLSKLAIADMSRHRVLMYDVDNGNSTFDTEISDYPIIVNPIDVAKYSVNGYYNYPYIIIITWGGSAIVVYDLTEGAPNNGFCSSYGLHQEVIPEESGWIDGHTRFFSRAHSIISQHSRIYVADTGHHRICQFYLNPQNGQLELQQTYDLGSAVTPIHISGDKHGGFYVVNGQSNSIQKFSSNVMSEFGGSLQLVDEIGENPNESLQLTSPTCIAATPDYVFVSQKITNDRGLVRGRVGGKIKNVNAYSYSNSPQYLRVNAIVTGTCYNVTLHRRPYGIDDPISEEIAEIAYAGILREEATTNFIERIEYRPFGDYEVWLSWNSATCSNPNNECSTFDDRIVVRCGTVDDVTEEPELSDCTTGSSDNLQICWNPPEANIVYYNARWSRLGEDDWENIRLSSSPLIFNAERAVPYLVEVNASRNDVPGPVAPIIVAHDVDSAPESFVLENRTSTSISFSADLPESANGWKLYYGTDPDNLNESKELWADDQLVLSQEMGELAHDQIYYFRLSGAVYTPEPAKYMLKEGPLSSNIISSPLAPTLAGNIDWDERWFFDYDPVIQPTDPINISSDGTLTIDPGVDVRIYHNRTISVYGGELNCNATPSNPTRIRVPVGAGGHRDGYTIIHANEATINLRNVEISGSRFGLLAIGSNVSIENSLISGNRFGLLLVRSVGSVVGCDLYRNNIDNGGYGAFIHRSSIDFIGNEFHSNYGAGLLVMSTDHVKLSKNSFHHNGVYNIWGSGVRMLNGYVEFSCNEIYDNTGPGVAMLQGYARMESAPGEWPLLGRNIIRDNNTDPNLSQFGQIFLEGTAALNVDYGGNHIEGTSLIYSINHYDETPPSDPTIPHQLYIFYARGNYWGTTDPYTIGLCTPSVTIVEPILETPLDCSETGPTDPYDDPARELFDQAMLLEYSAQYTAALESYGLIIDDYPKSKEAAMAVQRIAFCKKQTSQSWSDIRRYFLDLAVDIDPVIKMAALNTAAWCLVEKGDFNAAALEYQSLIDQSVKYYDIIYNSIGKMLAELGEEDWTFLQLSSKVPPLNTKTSGSLDEENSDSNKDLTLRPATHTVPKLDSRQVAEKNKNYAKKLGMTISRIDSLLNGIEISELDSEIPTNYALYQNFPNPFNPSTQIKYDLPESADVKLTIYNAMGQEVVQLQDAIQPAGRYIIDWDGKNSAGRDVATGTYIYRLKTGTFSDTKKMVLLR